MVTEFLLATYRLRQPCRHHEDAVSFCASLMTRQSRHALGNKEVVFIPLTTGSIAEFYIQPMVSCFGDVDVMHYLSDRLAMPKGYPPPSQLPAEFHSYVGVHEITDSEYPGYVYLMKSYILTENTDADKYDVAVWYSRSRYRAHEALPNENANYEIHGPAQTLHATEGELSPIDGVRCIRCLSWPTQANDWPTRHRNYGWPGSATVDRVVSNGCDVVEVAHRLCRQDEWMSTHQFRLSFSRTEIVLLNSWMPEQQIVYHMLRIFMKTGPLKDITDSTGTKVLSNYHIKTLMLWACELEPRSWWIDDLNVVKICVAQLHNLADWLKNKNCPHYFVTNCNLHVIDATIHVEKIASKLLSISESWLSTWFVNNYLIACAQPCPVVISWLFDDVSTSIKLQNALSAVVDWRLDTALHDLWLVCNSFEMYIASILYRYPLTVRSCEYWINELAKIDSCLCVYFNSVVFLHVVYKTTRNCLNDELIDVLTTILGQFVGKRRYCNKLSSVMSLSQAAKLMKVVANNSRSTMRLIEIELSKAYLYRALRCKDSDSDSIYCLANVYLAVLYYITGQLFQTAIDHCTLVTRSQDHSQCSSHVIQGEVLPKIDDDIDNVLGLAVFYQYVRATAFNQQQQTENVSVFTAELFAHYLQIRYLSVIKCHHQIQSSSTDVQQCITYILATEHFSTADVLLIKSVTISLERKSYFRTVTAEQRQKSTVNAAEVDKSELVELLLQSAVEHLTAYRQLQAQTFGSVATIVTTDFEALYTYKRGDYERCLQLSKQNVRILLRYPPAYMPTVMTHPEFFELFDDDFISLTALIVIVDPSAENIRWKKAYWYISQLTLSLYLMTQCQLKLHHLATDMVQTLDCIKVARTIQSVASTLDHLTLKLTERKIISAGLVT